jgi:hypothetical protein
VLRGPRQVGKIILLLEPAARRRELRALEEAALAFPQAEPLVVAGALPAVGTGELGVRVRALGRFLASGRDRRGGYNQR